VDPMAEMAHGWTPYRYSFNNPIKYFDPTGLWEFSTTDDGDKKRLQLQKSNDKDNLRTFRKESGLSNREIKNNLFGGGKEGKAAMKEFFGSGKSSINVSEFSGKTGTMLQGMETALNEGNAQLAKADEFTDPINNCTNSSYNLETTGKVDSNPLTNSSDPNSMMVGSVFDNKLSSLKNSATPKMGDIIRYQLGTELVHASIFLLNNGKSDAQIFTKNSMSNSEPFQIMNQSKLSSFFGSPTGKSSDKGPYYRAQ